MKLRRSNRAVAVALSAGAAALIGTPAAHALDDCGVGMDYDYQTQQCEPWAPVNVNNIYTPEIPVPIPNFNVVPDVNLGVGLGVGGVLPRVDAPLRDAPIHGAPIHDVPHAAPIHGGGRR